MKTVRLQNGKLLAVRIWRLVVYTKRHRVGMTNTPGGCVVDYRNVRVVAKPIYFHHTSQWTWRWLWLSRADIRKELSR